MKPLVGPPTMITATTFSIYKNPKTELTLFYSFLKLMKETNFTFFSSAETSKSLLSGEEMCHCE